MYKRQLTSLAGPDHFLEPHRALHNNMPIDGEQQLHKDSYMGFKRHVRSHRPWTIIVFYYPQETPSQRGPTGVVPGSHYALRNPGFATSDATPLGGPAGSVCLVAFNKRAQEEMRDRTRDLPGLQIQTLNALALGEAAAAHVGVDVATLRTRLIVVVALLCALAVAWCGLIGFIGLMAPHLVRTWAGADQRRVLPLSMAAGALLLVVADTVARTVVIPAEIPVGIFTALIGGPAFLLMLRGLARQQGGHA